MPWLLVCILYYIILLYMYNYLGLYIIVKLSYNFIKTNIFLYKDHIIKLYSGKLNFTEISNLDNIINFIRYNTDKNHIITFDYNIIEDNGLTTSLIYKNINNLKLNFFEDYHYKIAGVYMINKNKDISDKIKYVSQYLSKIYIISDKSYIEPDILLSETPLILKTNNINFFKKQFNYIMNAKKIDIGVSHNHPVNKFVHFWSSIIMIFYSYYYFFIVDYFKMCLTFLLAHIIRQSGHFFYERQDLNLEKLKFGHKNKSKKESIITLLIYNSLIYNYEDVFTYNDYLFMNIILCILPHYLEIFHKYGFVNAMNWIIKIITDPFTDILDFYKYSFISLSHFSDIKVIY